MTADSTALKGIGEEEEENLAPNLSKDSESASKDLHSSNQPQVRSRKTRVVSLCLPTGLLELGDRVKMENLQPQTNELKLKPMEETSKPIRRVSISEQTTHGVDNPAFEHHRRISGCSEPASEGRRKSILHAGSHHGSCENIENGRANGRKKSALSLSSSIRDKIEYTRELERSWLYLCCTRCHGVEESAESWEPPGWKRVCPPPFCPTYRKFARVLSLFILGLLIWGIVYCIIGDDAAPGGQLFGLATLCIAAHFGGWLFSLTTLPALIGMLMTGILLQNVGVINIEPRYAGVISNLRKFALVIILTRAGLDLDPEALKRLRVTVPKIGLIPWFVEAGVITLTTRYFLHLPWVWGFLLGSVIAAVSPAVVVPCLIRLRGKGYGVAKGIPTLIIAIAGIDDAASVAIFGIVRSIMFSNDSLWYQILQGPISIGGGIGFGILWGFLAKYVPEKNDRFMVPLRVLMLLGGGLIAVLGSETIELGGAGPLGVIAAAFVSCYFWQKEGWDVEDNPVATAFEIFWMIFEPILFGLTGTQVVLADMNGETVYLAIAALLCGGVIRILATILVGIGSKLNLKEKIFVAFSLMAKATVQAALGPVTLDYVMENTEEKRYADTVLLMCILSIIVTAPIGAIVISITGPKLLTKTRAVQPAPEGWNRLRRPSMRDISIINEEIDLEDEEDATKH
ncbi:sodium/hydrogen exchanger 9B2 [Athalia rosae]|uniref:sodium/hydrogen exchanger 9B2 n=1 Tax=Athalia rosae TaxID=37344 RepID=UPI002033BECF|nr:sodium/hydrogen exchanger 9B2 [Athalia rosae]